MISRFLVLIVAALLILQNLVFYIPKQNEDLPGQWAVEQHEETDKSEKETEKSETKSEKENFDDDWLHPHYLAAIDLDFRLPSEDGLCFNYPSPILSFLTPPPEFSSIS